MRNFPDGETIPRISIPRVENLNRGTHRGVDVQAAARDTGDESAQVGCVKRFIHSKFHRRWNHSMYIDSTRQIPKSRNTPWSWRAGCGTRHRRRVGASWVCEAIHSFEISPTVKPFHVYRLHAPNTQIA